MAAVHTVVSEALRYGELVRQPCAVCGAVKAVAHHEDYSKPLEVTWLCGFHHRQRHVELGWGTKGYRTPNGPKRVIVTFTVEPELLSRFDALARSEARTRSSQIVLSMRRLLEGEQR